MPQNPKTSGRSISQAFLPLFVGLSILAIGASAPPATSISDRTFETPLVITSEAQQTIGYLENVHLNREAVRLEDFGKAIEMYMKDLDQRRLFFLDTDRAELEGEYGNALKFNVERGRVNAAYAIFSTYARRAEARINWVLQHLDGDFDFTGDDTYPVDRSDAPWPSNSAEADDLWNRRLKYELLAELLSQTANNGDDAELAPEAEPVDPLVEAKDVVRRRYERLLRQIGETESLEIAESFLSAIARLYDPHSSYLSPDTFEDFEIQIRLELVGIGAVLETNEDDYCVIRELITGGPADLGKLLNPGDRIVAVAQAGAEAVDVVGMKLRKIVQLIRGTQGTNVHLTIWPAGMDSSIRREIVINRDVVKLNAQRAHAAIFDVPSAEGRLNKLGVITLPTFYGDGNSPEAPSATRDVAELITRLRDAGIEGLVLDLRRNGGGLLSEAIDLAGLFIDRGPVVQVKRYSGQVDVSSDQDPSVAYTGPLAVLVDRFSASASEIVAGALQNYGRAVVIGDTSTHGKGTVQTLVELQRDRRIPGAASRVGAVKLTVQKFYLPDGSSTQLKGVVPDIILPSPYQYVTNIGEQDLQNPLAWDEIPTSLFNGRPLDPLVRSSLLESSRQRQGTLPEFDFLNRYIDWFRQDQEELKGVSLNLVARQTKKEENDAFRTLMKAEFDVLSESRFAFTEFRLAEPPQRLVVEEEDEQAFNILGLNADGGYEDMDIALRESLRVLEDVLAFNQQALLSNASGPAPVAVFRPRNG
jgi:carboxyl-terminal processing protease